MKKFVLICALSVSCFSLAESKKETFVGEISDSQCATNVHSKTQSHSEMTSTHAMGNSKADCVQKCVKDMGGKYVLLTPKGKVYNLDNQTSSEAFAGKNVRVTGVLDADGKSITVDKMEGTR